MNIPTVIKQQLFAGGWAIVGSWGAHNWLALDENTLAFFVQGYLMKGIVTIKLDEARDLYDISFFKNRSYKSFLSNPQHAHEDVLGVYCDQMVEIIDNVVETA